MRQLPPEPRVVGPGFHARVFAAVRQVPAGHVTTYGRIAAFLGSRHVARHVGFAMAGAGHAEPPVPWFRVVNAQGALSGGADHARARQQRELLEEEGVEFTTQGRVSLARFGWTFPAP